KPQFIDLAAPEADVLAVADVHGRALIAVGLIAVRIANDSDPLHVAIDVNLHSSGPLSAVVRQGDMHPPAGLERPHSLDGRDTTDPARVNVPPQPAAHELNENAIAAGARHFVRE